MSSIELRDMKYTVLNSEQNLPLINDKSQQQQKQQQPPRKVSIATKSVGSGFNFNMSPFTRKKELANNNNNAAAAAAAATTSTTTTTKPMNNVANNSNKVTNGSFSSTIDSWPSKQTLNADLTMAATSANNNKHQRDKSIGNANSTFLLSSFPNDRRYSHLSMDEANALKAMAYETNYMMMPPAPDEIKLSNLICSLFQRCKNRNKDSSSVQLFNLNSQTYKIYFRKQLGKLKRLIIGFLFALAISLSFNLMVYLLRRTFNGIGMINNSNSTNYDYSSNQHHQRSNLNGFIRAPTSFYQNLISQPPLALLPPSPPRNVSSSSSYDANVDVDGDAHYQDDIFNFSLIIENNNTRTHESHCNFCYFLVWSTTSCLSVSYPIFLIYYFIFVLKCRPRGGGAGGGEAAATTATNASSNNNISSNNTNTNGNNKTASNATNELRYDNFGTMFMSSFQIFDSPQHNMMMLTKSQAEQTHNTNSTTINNRAARLRRRHFIFKLTGVTLLWLITGYSFVKALDILNCLDVVILYSVNFSFVYMAAWIFLHNLFIPLRLLGFILSIAALIFVFYSDGFLFDNKFLGNACATTSAAGSAVLQVIWQSISKNKTNNHRTMLLTLIGLMNLLIGWPMVLLLKVSGIETLNLYVNNKQANIEQSMRFITYLGISSALGLTYVYIMLFGSKFVDAIYVKIGSFFIIPISAIIDIGMNHVSMSDLKIGALISICVGYVFLILPETMYSDLKKLFCQEPSQDYVETNSLTRRYRHSTLPSTILNSTFPSQNLNNINSNSNTNNQQTSTGGGGAKSSTLVNNAQIRNSNLSISKSNI